MRLGKVVQRRVMGQVMEQVMRQVMGQVMRQVMGGLALVRLCLYR